MCFKELSNYTMCGCQDTIVHIRTCKDKLLKDDFGGNYGYARCPDADMVYTTGDPMRGWCPHCALILFDVVGDKLVHKSASQLKMVPFTFLPPKVKGEKGEKDKIEADDRGNKTDTKSEAVSVEEQNAAVELMTWG